jgi:hypothetical protein
MKLELHVNMLDRKTYTFDIFRYFIIIVIEMTALLTG